MRDAEYLYKVWFKDYYIRRSNSDSPFYKTKQGAGRVADRITSAHLRTGDVAEVHRFKITRSEL